MDRIILAFASEKAHAQITRILGSGGLAPSISCFSGAETIRAARKLGGAVVICGFRLRDMTAEMLAVALTGIAPVLVISSPGNLELCGDRNLIKLAVPSSRAEFFASLDLAQGVLAGGAPASRLHIQRSAEEERLICRAKAVLMEVNLMSEAEAHRFLQKYSMDTGLRLAETARLILERYTTG